MYHGIIVTERTKYSMINITSIYNVSDADRDWYIARMQFNMQ